MNIIEILATSIVAATVAAITALIVEHYRNRLKILYRYHESQFTLYNTLWGSLYKLKLVGDALWKSANILNLQRFAEQLRETEDVIGENFLLIEEEHFQELKRLIQESWNFRLGKERLINLYEKRERYKHMVYKGDIEEMIRHNRKIKNEYEYLIFEVGHHLKRQLKGSS